VPVAAEPAPSWASPIALGATVSFLGSSLLVLLGNFGGPGVVACCCVLPLAFLPFGFVPAAMAQRRDPSLTPGQGFAVSFIGVGLGMVLWAGVQFAIQSSSGAVQEQHVRQALEDALRQNPDKRLTDEQIDELVGAVAGLLPYVPVLFAGIVSLLAGAVGAVTVSLSRRRPRRGGGSDDDAEEPEL
jgi:hypothetical protein